MNCEQCAKSNAELQSEQAVEWGKLTLTPKQTQALRLLEEHLTPDQWKMILHGDPSKSQPLGVLRVVGPPDFSDPNNPDIVGPVQCGYCGAQPGQPHDRYRCR